MSTIPFECKLRRPPSGTRVTIEGVDIQFVPDNRGREIADVPEHLAHYLDAIPEGYARLYPDAAPSATAAPKEAVTLPANPTPPAPAPSPTDPDIVPIGEDDDDKSDGSTADNAPTHAANLAEMADDQLREVFEKEIGRRPSPRAGKDTMIAQIEQARAATPQ